MSAHFEGLTDGEFTALWLGMPQDEKAELDQAERAAAIQRYRELTPWIGAAVDRLDRSQQRIEQALDKPDITPAVAQSNVIDWSTLIGEPPPFRWLLDHWLSWHPTLLAGRGGIGKSLLVQQVGTALACGLPTWCEAVEPVNVLYWACEDDKDQLHRRQDLICKQARIGFESLENNFHVDARIGLENTLMTTDYGRPVWTPTIEVLRQQVNDWQIDVLFLDNIGHVFGGDENSRHVVTRFINGIAGLVTDRPFCPIFLGHPSKAPGSSYSGSTAWENSVRMRWYLDDKMPDQKNGDSSDPDPDPDYRILSKRKSNYTALDYVQLKFEAGTLQPIDHQRGDSGMIKMLRAKKAASVIRSAMLALAKANIYGNDTPGRSFLPVVIIQNKLAEGSTKAELTDAMRTMILSQELKREVVGKNSARHDIYGLKAAAT